ncbi:uncharacterized protein LOC112137733 [Oryzias melastigma]|uniref:uncharacterized protein LOC112137733 n=1 Tax=Oryzias melastigma TaxID=30732 RepID=UPI000CF82790|nr:uncharacterized protein LOC112137733 [Oryzias melastigma]
MADRQEEKLEYLPEEAVFRRNAFILITTMVDLSNQTPQDTSMLVEEVLHTLFFLGVINCPPFSPQSLLDDDDEILDYLKKEYPLPFQLYLTQLPRMSPFSCLLDMVVSLYGQENEDQIKDKLKKIVDKMKKDPTSNKKEESSKKKKERKPKIFFSSTICISRINISSSCIYYGVSMSTKGRPAGEILVASSCFSFWHRLVSDAVMTYYPDKQKKSYFSRNIKIPTDIKCEAFNISEGRPMDPCTSCSDLFGLDTNECRRWAHGSCAEVESLSNLFKGEQHVMEGLGPDENEQEGRLRAEKRVLKHLKKQLKIFKDFNWDGRFYPNLNPNTN